MDMIGKMTLEGHFKKTGMIGMITPESFSELLGILGDKEKCIESDEFIYEFTWSFELAKMFQFF
jgi:hypothetical protein